MIVSMFSRYSSLRHVARRTGAWQRLMKYSRQGLPDWRPGLLALAGAVLEHLAEQVERLAHPLGAGERAEVGAVARGASRA